MEACFSHGCIDHRKFGFYPKINIYYTVHQNDYLLQIYVEKSKLYFPIRMVRTVKAKVSKITF